MSAAGSNNNISAPLWLVTEITYKCPLQCPYCYNPLDFAKLKPELTTEEWTRVITEARELGVVQLGFSGGEPLVRQDLEQLVALGKELGFYSNLITSGVGMDEARMAKLRECGLDSIQISFQANEPELNAYLAGTDVFDHKVEMARAVKSQGYPLTFNIVLHKHNIDQIEHILNMAMELDADFVELANTQYYGFGLHNRDQLLPTREQVARSEYIAKQYQQRYTDKKIYYVIPDYFENRPKPCMNGWGSSYMVVTSNGLVLPCHSARVLPDIEFENIKDHDLKWIWEQSPSFNHFRGEDWMKEPCKTCPERKKDFGGCRCQAYLLTKDAYIADPVCDLSPHHHLMKQAIKQAEQTPGLDEHPLVFRNAKNSNKLSC